MSSRLEVIHPNWPDRTFPEFGAKAEGLGVAELCELTRKYGFLLTNTTDFFPAGWGPVPKPGIFWHFPHSDGDVDTVSALWCSSDKVYEGRSTGVCGLDLGVRASTANLGLLREMEMSSASKDELIEIESSLRNFENDPSRTKDVLNKLQRLRSFLGRFDKLSPKPKEFVTNVVKESKTHEHIWRKGDIMAVSSKALHCRMNGTDYDALRVADFHN